MITQQVLPHHASAAHIDVGAAVAFSLIGEDHADRIEHREVGRPCGTGPPFADPFGLLLPFIGLRDCFSHLACSVIIERTFNSNCVLIEFSLSSLLGGRGRYC